MGGFVGGTLKISGSTFYLSGSTTVLEGLGVTGSIIPGKSNAFDLGSPTHVWRDIFVSENSLRFVSSSGKITRFEQRDVEDIKEGKVLQRDTAIDGQDRILRAQGLFHETADNHYIKTTTAGIWDFVGPGGQFLQLDGRAPEHNITLVNEGAFITRGFISASNIGNTHTLGGPTRS